MDRCRLSLLLLLLILTTIPLMSQSAERGLVNDISRRAAAYIENRGQWPDEVRFQTRIGNRSLWLTRNSITYDLFRIDTTASMRASDHGTGTACSAQGNIVGHVVRMVFVGAVGAARSQGVAPGPELRHFFVGNDSRRWVRDVRAYPEVRLERLYRGIDARFYFDDGAPRYDLIVAPEADPSSIRLHFDGATGVRIGSNGDLEILTSAGPIVQRELLAYQTIDGKRSQVGCAFKLQQDGSVGFAVERYDRTRPLVIDPLLFSTYLGGAGLDRAEGIGLDSARNVYVTGITNNSTFPTTAGAYSRSLRGTSDVFVSKFDSTGSRLLFSTLVGGLQGENGAAGRVAADGTVYVATSTEGGFPTTDNAYDRTFNGGIDAAIFKLGPNGRALDYATYLGGQGADNATDLTMDSQGNVYVVGTTSSMDLPTTAGAFQSTGQSWTGYEDGWAARLRQDMSLAYCTYVGSSSQDRLERAAVDSDGHLVIIGTTSGPTFPTTSEAYQPGYGGGAPDGILLKLDTGGGLLASTFIGGTGADNLTGVAVDSLGSVLVTGITQSPDFPATSNAFSIGAHRGVLMKFDPTLSQLIFSARIPNTTLVDVASDADGTIYAAGYAADGFPTTPSAFDGTYADGGDLVVMRVNPGGTNLLYGSYIGGLGREQVHAITITPEGGLYLCGSSDSSTTFPTTPGAYDSTYDAGEMNNSYDAIVVALPAPKLTLGAATGGRRLCAGSTVRLAWSATDVDTVTIELSDDDGATWPTVLAAQIAPPGRMWDWTIPADYEGASYRLRIRESYGTVTDTEDSSFAILPPVTITEHPADTSVCSGDGTMTFRVVASGGTLRYRWLRNGVPISGQAASRLSLAAVDTNNGTYMVEITGECGRPLTSRPATLVVHAPPSITSAPATTLDTICEGQPYSILFGTRDDGFVYTWYHNGLPLNGTFSNSFATQAITPDMAGTYRLVVTSPYCPDSVASSGIIEVVVVPPTRIVREPRSQRVCSGLPITFDVAASGVGLRYTWYKDGREIGHDSALTISSARREHSGNYRVAIQGSCGTTIFSSVATLVVTASEPVIPAQPQSMIVVAGTPIRLSLGADEQGYTYLWRRNGEALMEQTSATLLIDAATLADSGWYDCIVISACDGADTTLPALVTVLPTPTADVAAHGRLSLGPNPSRGRVTIDATAPFTSRAIGIIRLTVRDLIGRAIATIDAVQLPDGSARIELDGTGLATGLYYCTVTAGSWQRTISMTIIR